MKYALILTALAAVFCFPAHAATPSNTYCSSDSGVTWLPCNPTGGGGGGSAVTIQPSASSAVGIIPVVSTSLESGHVLKASPGNLYTVSTIVTTVSGYLLLFDATTVPADGAVAPKFCFPIISSGTNGGIGVSYLPGPPLNFSTGIAASFSSTGCFTKTASATAYFSAQVQ